jgi:dTDP-4-dehydrorhamnose reductase
MRVAVTGANGRLGRALVGALGDAPFTGPAGPIAWTRTDFDLDAPATIGELLDRDRPEVVVNAAAWTDVDGCARDPDLALRRNGDAVRVLAEATVVRGIDLVQISTNEVFDGRRAQDRGYRPDDPASPVNPYGASKLAGETSAAAAYRDGDANFAVVRTSWLFGPPGSDFPTKILASAAAASAERQPMKVVADEFGSPTFSHDLAEAIAAMLGADIPRGVQHVVNAGIASRAQWARELFRQAGVDVTIEAVSMSDWTRASTPPAWGVLEPTEIPGVEPLRPWQQALADYLPLLRRQRTAAAAG